MNSWSKAMQPGHDGLPRRSQAGDTTVFVGNCAGLSGWSSGTSWNIWILGSPWFSFHFPSPSSFPMPRNDIMLMHPIDAQMLVRACHLGISTLRASRGEGRCVIVICNVVDDETWWKWVPSAPSSWLTTAIPIICNQTLPDAYKHHRTTLINLQLHCAAQTKTNLSAIVATASWEKRVEPFQWGWASQSIQNKY